MNKLLIKSLAIKVLSKRRLFLKKPIQDNIYFATTQKAGSTWVKNIFNDPRIKKYTMLDIYPQHRYEWDQFHKKFPRNTFVPGLYMSYDLYEEIIKPKNYKSIYITRDPRDIVVSWYHSMLKTHRLMGKVKKYRDELEQLSFDDGISYSIKALSFKFSAMRTWFISKDPNVLILKFEYLTEKPLEGFKKIFEHCEIEIPDNELEIILDDYTKEKMRMNDIKKRTEKKDSHYRKKRSSYKDSFTETHLELFNEINGDLLKVLNYD